MTIIMIQQQHSLCNVMYPILKAWLNDAMFLLMHLAYSKLFQKSQNRYCDTNIV